LAQGTTRIQLCGRFVVRCGPERLEEHLPGRQARMLLAYLVLHRTRAVGRQELAEAIWYHDAPSASGIALRVLLSKLRASVGPERIAGKGDVRLVLPGDAWIDVEEAELAIHLAEAAAAQREWHRAYAPAHVARYIAERALLPGLDAPWIDQRRREHEELRARALECCAAVQLAIGGAELPIAERAARLLIEAAPFRESGYRLLMEILAARDNAAEALTVYERLRCTLRDELGTAPGPAAQALHRGLLQGRHVTVDTG
jgi:SARP family transcriptional regulator, regulator of embCAB operon